MIRHIFCDLDGTLYNNGINEDDVKAIKEIEKEGVIFHVATGRVFKQAYKMINEKIKLNGYFICENGSFIFDKDKNLIFKEPLDDYLVRKIINTFDSNSSHIYLKYDGNVVLSGGESPCILKHLTGKVSLEMDLLDTGWYKVTVHYVNCTWSSGTCNCAAIRAGG